MKWISISGGIIICFFITLAGLYQTLRYVQLTPAGYVFPLVHNYEQDYFWYLSLMRQGWDGSLAATTKYTAEVFRAVPVNTFFPVFGLMARLVSVPLPLMYTLLRLLGAGGLLFGGYFLSRKLLPEKNQWLPAFVLTVFGAPATYLTADGWRMAGEFWTGFDPIFRIAWLPHHTISNALFILLLILDLRFTIYELRLTPKIKILLNSFLSFFAAWLNPAAGLLIFFIFGILFSVNFFKRDKSKILNNLLVLTGAGIALLSLYFIQNSTFPWTAFRDWERFTQYPVDVGTYLMILGLPGFLAIGGIFRAMNERSWQWLPVALWYLFPFAGLLVLSNVLGVSNSRFLQSAGYIPAGLLSGYFLTGLYGIKKRWGRYLFFGLLALILIQSVPAFVRSFEIQEYYLAKNLTNPLVVVPEAEFTIFDELNRLPETGLVIAPERLSIMIPAFTKHRVYSGHPTFTYNPPGRNKSRELAEFLYGDDEGFRQAVIQKENPLVVITDTEKPTEILTLNSYQVFKNSASIKMWVKE